MKTFIILYILTISCGYAEWDDASHVFELDEGAIEQKGSRGSSVPFAMRFYGEAIPTHMLCKAETDKTNFANQLLLLIKKVCSNEVGMEKVSLKDPDLFASIVTTVSTGYYCFPIAITSDDPLVIEGNRYDEKWNAQKKIKKDEIIWSFLIGTHNREKNIFFITIEMQRKTLTNIQIGFYNKKGLYEAIAIKKPNDGSEPPRANHSTENASVPE